MKLPLLALALFGLLLFGCTQYGGQAAASGTPVPGGSVTPPAGIGATPNPSGGLEGLPGTAQLTGSASCSTGNKTNVIFYHDPYCPACVANDPKVNAFFNKYSGKSADVRYGIVVTHSRTLAQKYGKDEIFVTHDFHVCAQEQGKIQEFKDCFYDVLKTDGSEFLPVSAADLRACAKKTGMDEDKLDACLPGARQKVDAQLVEAAQFGGGTFFTPMAVVDCRYRVNSALTEPAFCALSEAC